VLDERLRVLQLVEAGTVTAHEGAQLLEALDEAARREASPSALRAGQVAPAVLDLRRSGAPGVGAEQWLRVRVVDRTGRPRVDVRVPLSVLGLALRIGGRWVPQLRLLHPDMLLAAMPVRAGQRAFRLEDRPGGDRIEIVLE
jgi:hypothetical protein